MKLRWFLSGTVREAIELCNHVRKLSNAQRDLLSPHALETLEAAQKSTQKAIDDHADNETLRKQMAELEAAANKWLKPYPFSEWRENVEVFLVAIAVAMAIRTFFLQPFKIPTGSMQPTLYGVEYEPVEKIPGQFGRIWDAAVHGEFYHYLKAAKDGELIKVDPPQHFLRFINRQTIWVRYDGDTDLTPLSVWFAPDSDPEQQIKFLRSAKLLREKAFKKDDYIFKTKEVVGDHLFVDRLSYNFRAPTRGDIIVFKTEGIMHPQMPQDQFYIKRLLALGGEKVSIGDDQHVRINGNRLDASTPHFENVYTFGPIPKENHYFGHVNETIARRLSHPGLAPYFPTEETIYEVPPHHYMVMGDNTLNSWDSRGWGDFPRENVIGKYFFVYWPISNHNESRFGWSQR
jgi:signal peptidase I